MTVDELRQALADLDGDMEVFAFDLTEDWGLTASPPRITILTNEDTGRPELYIND